MHRTVYLKTTESCNLSCKHCFTEGSIPKRYFWNTNKTIDWIDRLITHSDTTDTIHFELHGGEPMLAPMSGILDVSNYIINQKNRLNISLGMTSNLVYKLNQEKIDFIINKLDTFGTSWDPDIRFNNINQLNLWKSNVKTLVDNNKKITLFISLTKGVTKLNQEELLLMVKELGFTSLHFERITPNGNALLHQELFPSNIEINEWYMNLHNAVEKLNARNWFYISTLEDVYTKFEKYNFCSGTFCRDCQEKLFTVNANGSIAGCPNSAPTEYFGHITQSIDDLLKSNRRLDSIVKERIRNPNCFNCPVFKYCGSDCHKLEWDGDICPAPKKLMISLMKKKEEYVNARLKELKSSTN